MKEGIFILFFSSLVLSCENRESSFNSQIDQPTQFLYKKEHSENSFYKKNDQLKESAAPKWNWVRKVTKTGTITPMAYAKMITDSLGNSYITNYIPTQNKSDDIFLVKYDVEGNVVWEKTFGGLGRDSGHDLAFDNEGNIWLVGYFFEMARFGTITLIGDSDYNLFLAKLNSNGECLNAYKVATNNRGFSYSNGNVIGNGQLGGFSISVSKMNEILLSGEFEKELYFESIELNSDRRRSSFIAKFDLKGNCMWALKAESSNWCYSSMVYTSSKGDSYFLSSCADTLWVGDKYEINKDVEEKDKFLAMVSTNGDCRWIKKLDYVADEKLVELSNPSIAEQDDESIYFAIRRDSSKRINPKFDNQKSEVLFAELNLNGQFVRAIPLGNGLEDSGRTIWANTTDSQKNIYLAGSYCRDTYFGTKKILFNESRRQSGFIAKYNPDGTCEWVKVIPCYGKIIWIRSLAIHKDKLFVSGNYQVRAHFDEFNIETGEPNENVNEIFLAQLNVH